MFYNNNQQSKSNIDGWNEQENKKYVLEKQHTNMRQLGKEGNRQEMQETMISEIENWREWTSVCDNI